MAYKNRLRIDLENQVAESKEEWRRRIDAIHKAAKGNLGEDRATEVSRPG